jgi:hypothetical protein
LLRLDDTTGERDVALRERTDAANRFGADFYLAIHHNAGVGGKAGGGIVAIVYKTVDSKTTAWQLALYNAVIAATGLRGNRSQPLGRQNLHEVRESRMPAVLLECGFMDSTVDTPIILTEEFADKCAAAISEVLITRCGLTEKKEAETEQPKSALSLPTVSYQVYTSARGWLPNVEGDSDYAGIKNQPIRCLYASLSRGDIEYQVHTLGGRWLPWVKNREDYAGLYGKDIDCVRVRLLGDPDCSVQCRVAAVGKNYYPWVTDNNDYAGVYGKKIDRLQLRIISKK